MASATRTPVLLAPIATLARHAMPEIPGIRDRFTTPSACGEGIARTLRSGVPGARRIAIEPDSAA